MKVIEVSNVTKIFGDKKVVDNVSFSVKKGEIIALLGENGAGKTTTILMMLGLIQPTSGTITIFGHSPGHRNVRKQVGVMLQEVTAINELFVEEVIYLFTTYYKQPYTVEQLLKISHLEKERKKKATDLSGGQMRRLNFALALAGNPNLLFLDEPTVGMDTISRKHFWKEMQQVANKGKTILFTTHYLEEADLFSKRVLLFHKGKVIADASTKALRETYRFQTISFFSKEKKRIMELTKLQEVQMITKEEGRFYIRTTKADELLYYLFTKNIDVRHVLVSEESLEDVFEAFLQKESV